MTLGHLGACKAGTEPKWDEPDHPKCGEQLGSYHSALVHDDPLSSAERIVSTVSHRSRGVGTAAMSQPNLTKAAITS